MKFFKHFALILFIPDSTLEVASQDYERGNWGQKDLWLLSKASDGHKPETLTPCQNLFSLHGTDPKWDSHLKGMFS